MGRPSRDVSWSESSAITTVVIFLAWHQLPRQRSPHRYKLSEFKMLELEIRALWPALGRTLAVVYRNLSPAFAPACRTSTLTNESARWKFPGDGNEFHVHRYLPAPVP